MTPEEKSLLERTYALSEENNQLLKSIRRSGRVRTVFHILYWAIILALSFGAYYLVQPYVTTLLGAFDQVGGLPGIKGNLDQAQNAATSLRDLLK